MKTDLKMIKIDSSSSNYDLEEQKRIDDSYTGKQINLLRKIEEMKKNSEK